MTTQEIQDTVDSHRLLKLIELCTEHNDSVRDSYPDRIIDLEKYTTADDLVFNLWFHHIDVGVLGFGHPYDEILKGWLHNCYEEPSKFEENLTYLSYIHYERISPFLSYALLLPKKHGSYYPFNEDEKSLKLNNNMLKLKEIWSNIGREEIISDYHDLRKILRANILTRIELCCLLSECDNYDIFNLGLWQADCLDGLV